MNAKNILRIAGSFLLGGYGLASALVAPVQIPSITFYADGRPPAITQQLRVTERIYVSLLNASNTQVPIYLISVTGSTVHIQTEPPFLGGSPLPVPVVTDFVFDRAAYLHAVWTSATQSQNKSLGNFRVLPIVSTIPKAIIANQASTLKLVMGQTHSACPPTYADPKAFVDGKNIKLTFAEMLPAVCIDLYVDPPTPYGPEFKLPGLAAGTYQLILEDTAAIESLHVYERMTLQGSAMIMQNPYIRMMARPVAGAMIRAFEDPDYGCLAPYPLPAADTFRTMTDVSGLFSVEIPKTGEAYRITAMHDLYHPQEIYFNSDSAKKSVAFELIDKNESAAASLEIVVTKNHVPVAGANVYIIAGRELFYCLQGAKSLAVRNYTDYKTTGADGRALFENVSLSPFIDYIYHVSSASISRSGSIRLNKYIVTRLEIDFSASGMQDQPAMESGENPIHVFTSPASPLVQISLSSWQGNADAAVYDLAGKVIARSEKIRDHALAWNTENVPSGVYVIHVTTRTKRFIKNFVLMK